MITQYIAVLPLILGVTAASALLVAIRSKAMAMENSSKAGLVAGYVVGGVVFGAVAIFVYTLFANWWPATAASNYLWAALGLAVLLTAAATAMRFTVLDNAPVIEWTLLNFGWALAYGLLLPRLLAAA